MSATRFNDAALLLFAAYQGAEITGLVVYDTAQPTAAADTDWVVVGHDGTLTADGQLNPAPVGGTWTQGDIDFGDRQETGYVNCLIISQTGDAGDAAGRRQRASDLLQALEDAAAVNGGKPPAGNGLMFTGTSDGRWIPHQAMGGVAILVPYRVYYSTKWD